jgi:hypothetical protein
MQLGRYYNFTILAQNCLQHKPLKCQFCVKIVEKSSCN